MQCRRAQIGGRKGQQSAYGGSFLGANTAHIPRILTSSKQFSAFLVAFSPLSAQYALASNGNPVQCRPFLRTLTITL
jgi:hypothetical protein